MVLPIHDVNPLRRTPVVTYLLIAVNVVVFLLEPVHHLSVTATGLSAPTYCQQVSFFDEYAAIPRELVRNAPDRHVVIDTRTGRAVCSDYFPHKRPWLSVLTAMFLHGSWAHLLGNMLFLLIFGNNVEDRLGRLKFLLFYLVCGYAAAYGYAALNADSSTTLVGASGAIAGVLGAYIVVFPRAWVISLLGFIPIPLPAWIVLGSWFVLQGVYATGTAVAAGAAVAYVAHVVGFVVGALLILPMRQRLRAAGPLPSPTRPVLRG